MTKVTHVRDLMWRKSIVQTAKGRIKSCQANVAVLLGQHPAWDGVLAYNEFSERVVKLKDPPTGTGTGDWTDTDTACAISWMTRETVGDINVGAGVLDSAVVEVAHHTKFHPVREYLQNLPWDGKERLPTVMHDVFGAVDSEYTRLVGAMWLVSCVARVMRPGCKVDTTVVLEGKTGRGKSTAVQMLSGEDWFSDSDLRIGDKEAYETIRGVWIYEVAEFDSFGRAALTAVKKFLSARRDNYRPSYGRRNVTIPRQTVFVCTTNEKHYLQDKTGNRRYWPVDCGHIDLDILKETRDALWAEAYARYKRGEKWHADRVEQERLFTPEQEERVASDDWLPLISQWLDCPTVPDNDGGKDRLLLSEGITTTDVLLGALAKRPGDLSKLDSMRAAECLRTLGWAGRKEKRGSAVVRVFRLPPSLGGNSGGNDVAPQNHSDVATLTPVDTYTYTQDDHESHFSKAGSAGNGVNVATISDDNYADLFDRLEPDDEPVPD